MRALTVTLLLLFVLMILTLSGCGFQVDHDHSGEIIHRIEVSSEALDEYFNYICNYNIQCIDDQKLIFRQIVENF
jgi:uncharacterized protein YceK